MSGVNNGHGVYAYSDGNLCIGSQKDNKRHGEGTFILANGKKQIGIWKEDKFFASKENHQDNHTSNNGPIKITGSFEKQFCYVLHIIFICGTKW